MCEKVDLNPSPSPPSSETFHELVATKYYDDQIGYEMVKQLVAVEAVQRLRLLKTDHEPLHLAAP